MAHKRMSRNDILLGLSNLRGNVMKMLHYSISWQGMRPENAQIKGEEGLTAQKNLRSDILSKEDTI